MAGIESLAFHFPAYSIRAEEYVRQWGAFRARGVAEKTVAGFDEDEVTLAVAAARRLPEAEVGYLATATFGGPPLAGTVAAALGLEDVRRADFGGSTNAVGEALLSGLDFVDARGERALLVAADVARGAPDDPREHGQGAAAVALPVGPEGPLEAEEAAVHGREASGEAFLDAEGRRRSLEVVGRAGEVLPRTVGRVLEEGARLAGYEPDGAFLRRALGDAVPEGAYGGGVVARSGDTGCASALLALAETLRQASPGEAAVLATYGSGASVALRLRLTAPLRGVESPLKALEGGRTYLDYGTYARVRRFLATRGEEVSQGAYVPLPGYLEAVDARYRLVAGRCVGCGHLHFPPRPTCLSCGHPAFDPEPLSGKGEVHAATVIARGSAPAEFREQQDVMGEYAVALVQLQEGPRIVAQMTDCDPAEAAIGTPVEATLRRIYRQEGVVRYGYKFRPSAGNRRPAEGTPL